MSKIKKINFAKSYEKFWKWFQKHEQTFFKAVKEDHKIEQNFFNKIAPKLDKIKEGFYFLTGMYDDNTVELVFTAEGDLANIVFVEELVAAAPKIDGWLFSALKSPSDSDVYIEMEGYTFSDKNIYFYSNDNKNFPDEINISFVHDDLNEENRNIIGNGVFTFLDNYLGELNLLQLIDTVDLVSKEDAEQKLVPIEKIKAFLNWRQKEFVEKYDGVRHHSAQDNYTLFRAELENEIPLVATINTDLLDWDSKASHPWVLIVDILFDATDNNGMPSVEQNNLLEEIDHVLQNELKEEEGFLCIGRQTGDSHQEIYFACKDFRLPSKIIYQVVQQYASKLVIQYDLFKDKYWTSFDRFTNI